MPLTFGRDVLDEGEFAQLVCIVSKGDEPLTISWALKGDVISSEPTLTTASLGTRTSMLTIGSVGYRHSGTYTCTAKNDAGVTAQTAHLKVNGNISAYSWKGVSLVTEGRLKYVLLFYLIYICTPFTNLRAPNIAAIDIRARCNE